MCRVIYITVDIYHRAYVFAIISVGNKHVSTTEIDIKRLPKFQWSNSISPESSPIHIYENPQENGNCQFVALSNQLKLAMGINITSERLRLEVATHLKQNPATSDGTKYDQFCSNRWDAYLSNMSKNSSYGDNITTLLYLQLLYYIMIMYW